MKSKWVSLLLAGAVAVFAQQFEAALPGYEYQFPRDYFNHPSYQTEWWYYTGNLRASDGHRFGIELTFFRFGVSLSKTEVGNSTAAWSPNQIYVAHLALSDIDGKTFHHSERVNRAGPGLAGLDDTKLRYWNGNWSVQWTDVQRAAQHVQAISDVFSLQLDLVAAKPVVINGMNGVSQKGSLPGEASHYLSFTRLKAGGNLNNSGHAFQVTGTVWMDHEFFTQQIDKALAGWDWFAIQLDNNEELMLYRLRSKDGKADRYSSGTFIDANGVSHFLDSSQFQLSPAQTWQSPHSKATYPIAWEISVPSLGLRLSQDTLLKDQELFHQASGPTPVYWEGAVTYAGKIHDHPVSGVGYLELTGYAR